MMETKTFLNLSSRIAARGSILVFFIMAFEVMIMISPFAFFFYSVFNPVLHWLGSSPATSWLTTFFLPHMILPPTSFLKAIRIIGSALFLIGAVTFMICALQVYLGKIFKWGIADQALYRIIRHPQYLALGIWGVGMSILWPRFLVLASLSLMLILYYFLAKNEEWRMLTLFGDSYQRYMDRTGMFLPRKLEARLSAPLAILQGNAMKDAAIIICLPVLVIGVGFILREVTLSSLPYQAKSNVTLVSILPEDDVLASKVIDQLFATGNSDKLALFNKDRDYLGYVMPPDYVMQGMIANTGDEFHLHKQEHTFALIADWVMNPFEHLRRSPSAQMASMNNVDPRIARRHHCPLGVNDKNLSCESCPYERIIFLEADHGGNGRLSKGQLLALDVVRVPVGFIDINTQTGEIINAKKVEKATAWRDVPTPSI